MTYTAETLIEADLVIENSTSGLTLRWNRLQAQPLNFFIDVEKLVKQLRSYPAPKQGAFNQALGKKTKHVIDATGGWAGDALLMCSQGYEVTVIEREPVIALLLIDAMQRLSRTSWAQYNNVIVPKVIHADAIDCIYLDPMFPPKKKKSAAVNKQMQLLQWLVGEDLDASELLQAAITNNRRIAVKRPDYAMPLYTKPSMQFSSKLVHYDVYLPK